MRKFVLPAIILLSALTLHADIIIGGAVNGNGEILQLGDAVVGTSATTGPHITAGHVQGPLELIETGLSEVAEDMSVTIRTNGATLIVERATGGTALLGLTDMGGAGVHQTVLSERTELIDLQDLPGGVYIATVSADGKLLRTAKFIKH